MSECLYVCVCVCVESIHIISVVIFRQLLRETHGRALTKMKEDCRQQTASNVILHQY